MFGKKKSDCNSTSQSNLNKMLSMDPRSFRKNVLHDCMCHLV